MVWTYLNDENCYRFFVDNGFVYTLRKTKYEGKAFLKRGGEVTKIRVFRRFIKWINGVEQLGDYFKESGFQTADEWWQKALELNGKPPFRLFKFMRVN